MRPLILVTLGFALATSSVWNGFLFPLGPKRVEAGIGTPLATFFTTKSFLRVPITVKNRWVIFSYYCPIGTIHSAKQLLPEGQVGSRAPLFVFTSPPSRLKVAFKGQLPPNIVSSSLIDLPFGPGRFSMPIALFVNASGQISQFIQLPNAPDSDCLRAGSGCGI